MAPNSVSMEAPGLPVQVVEKTAPAPQAAKKKPKAAAGSGTKVWSVKIPRVSTVEVQTRLTVAEARIEAIASKVEIIKMAVRVKNVSKQTAQSDMTVVRDKLRVLQTEIRAKLDVLLPLKRDLNEQASAARGVRDAAKDLPARTAGELDRKIAALEFRLMHEVIPLKEEKDIIKQIKVLKTKYGDIEENTSSAALVNLSKEARGDLHTTVKALGAEVDVLRLQEGAQRQMFDKLKEELTTIEGEVQASLDDRTAAQKELNEAYDVMKAAKNEKWAKEKTFFANRKQAKKLAGLVGKGDTEAATALAKTYNDSIHEKLNGDSAYRAAYVDGISQRNVQWLASVLGPWGDALLEKESAVEGYSEGGAKKDKVAETKAKFSKGKGGADKAEGLSKSKSAQDVLAEHRAAVAAAAAAKKAEAPIAAVAPVVEAAVEAPAPVAAKPKAEKKEKPKPAPEKHAKVAAAPKPDTSVKKSDVDRQFEAEAAQLKVDSAKQAVEILRAEKLRVAGAEAERKARAQARRAEESSTSDAAPVKAKAAKKKKGAASAADKAAAEKAEKASAAAVAAALQRQVNREAKAQAAAANGDKASKRKKAPKAQPVARPAVAKKETTSVQKFNAFTGLKLDESTFKLGLMGLLFCVVLIWLLYASLTTPASIVAA